MPLRVKRRYREKQACSFRSHRSVSQKKKMLIVVVDGSLKKSNCCGQDGHLSSYDIANSLNTYHQTIGTPLKESGNRREG